MANFLSWCIRCYKKILSPLFGPHCRFYPSCSSYFLQALDRHGAAKGSWLGIKRLCRCHPLNEGGLDPVPGTTCRHEHAVQDTAASLAENAINTHKETGISHGY